MLNQPQEDVEAKVPDDTISFQQHVVDRPAFDAAMLIPAPPTFPPRRAMLFGNRELPEGEDGPVMPVLPGTEATRRDFLRYKERVYGGNTGVRCPHGVVSYALIYCR